MIDLAPVAVAPTDHAGRNAAGSDRKQAAVEPEPTPEEPPEIAETPPEPEPEKPVETVDIKPEPITEPELALLPPPKPIIEQPSKSRSRKRKRPRRKSGIASPALPARPSAADRKADRAAAPMPGASARNSNALPNWQSQLMSQTRTLQAISGARRAAIAAPCDVAFSVDRSGGVHQRPRCRAAPARQLLDREALSTDPTRAARCRRRRRRLRGTQIAIVVPIRYNMR